MSRQIGRMRQNVVILATHRQDHVGQGIVKRRRKWKMLQFVIAMFTSKQGFVSKQPRGKRLENNFASLFGNIVNFSVLY